HARLEASMDQQPPAASIGAMSAKARMTLEWTIDRHLSVKREMAVELIRCDTRHDMRDIVQRECLADDVRIGSEMVLPVPVSNDDGRFGFSRRGEARPSKQRHADRLEVVPRDEHRPKGLPFEFALPVRPTHEGDTGIGVT